MGYFLTGTVQDRPIRREVGPDDTVTIGRAGSCEVQVAAPSVSREHAEIAGEGEQMFIRDLGSRNGTWVNGNRIAGRTQLRPGDRVEIGGVLLGVESDSVSAPSPQTIFARDADMAASAAINWREIYGGAPPTNAGAAAVKKLNLFQVLAEAGDLLTAQLQLEELLESILDLVERGVSAERAVLLLVEDGTGEPVVRASRIKGSSEEQIMLSKTMVEKVMTERTSILTLDAKEDPRFEKQQSIILQGTRSAMAAPLFDNENVIGVLYADTTDAALRYSKDELRAFTILANLIGVKITQATLASVQEANRAVQQELATAKTILNRILPAADELCQVPGYEVCAFQEPCLTVGGDLFDCRRLADGRTAVIMGDVTGKGLGAALLVSNIMASLELLLDEVDDPVKVVSRLNRQVHRFTDPVHFATFFLGLLDPATGELTFVNAGHNPPLVVTTDGELSEVPSTGIPVGMFEDMEYTSGTVTLAPGTFILLYSDGIPEAETPDGAEYGMERLEQLLIDRRADGATGMVDAIQTDVASFLGEHPPTDDVTMLLVRRLAG